MTNNNTKEVLKMARQTYGNRNQISVAIEELCELCCALSKYVRYDDDDKGVQETREKVIDELADVYIVIEHIKAIYNVTPEEIGTIQRAKIARLERWLRNSASLEYSTVDREVTVQEEGMWCHNCGFPVTVNIHDKTCPACRQQVFLKEAAQLPATIPCPICDGMGTIMSVPCVGCNGSGTKVLGAAKQEEYDEPLDSDLYEEPEMRTCPACGGRGINMSGQGMGFPCDLCHGSKEIPIF